MVSEIYTIFSIFLIICGLLTFLMGYLHIYFVWCRPPEALRKRFGDRAHIVYYVRDINSYFLNRAITTITLTLFLPPVFYLIFHLSTTNIASSIVMHHIRGRLSHASTFISLPFTIPMISVDISLEYTILGEYLYSFLLTLIRGRKPYNWFVPKLDSVIIQNLDPRHILLWFVDIRKLKVDNWFKVASTFIGITFLLEGTAYVVIPLTQNNVSIFSIIVMSSFATALISKNLFDCCLKAVPIYYVDDILKVLEIEYGTIDLRLLKKIKLNWQTRDHLLGLAPRKDTKVYYVELKPKLGEDYDILILKITVYFEVGGRSSREVAVVPYERISCI